MAPIPIALVEDDPSTRERLIRAIAANNALQLAFAAASVREITGWLSHHAVAVLLVDLGLPDGSGIDVIHHCRRVQPACEVMVITLFGDEANMLRAFEAGARGYLLKDGSEADLAGHVLNLHAGGSPMSPIIARQLLMRWQAAGPKAPAGAGPALPAAISTSAHKVAHEVLSPREAEVLHLVARGYTYPEIGQQLGVSITTVHTHVRNIYAKLDVHNRTEAVFEARQLGLLR